MGWKPTRIYPRQQYDSDNSIERTVWKFVASEAPKGMLRGLGLPQAHRDYGRVESKFLTLNRRKKLQLEKRNIRPARGTLRLGG